MHPMQRIQVMIVDDHPLFRRGIRQTLEEAATRLAIVGEAEDGMSALALADRITPDVALLDVNMPGMSGFELARALKQRHPRLGIVIVTMHEDDEQLFHAIRAGAAAYCTKNAAPADLVDTVLRVARGEYLINDSVLAHPFVAARVLQQFRELGKGGQVDDTIFSPLTTREIEVLDSIARGNSNKEIGQLLGISDQTVKNHVTSILRKLQVNDRTQAVIYALRHGWINLSGSGAEAMHV
jgi:DNA-binding NarL/FixJ family response regulator